MVKVYNRLCSKKQAAYRFLPSKILDYTFIDCGIKENAESNTNNRKNEEQEISYQCIYLKLPWKQIQDNRTYSNAVMRSIQKEMGLSTSQIPFSIF